MKLGEIFGPGGSLNLQFSLLVMLLALPSAHIVAQDFAPETLAGRSLVVVISGGSGGFADIGGYRVTFSESNYDISPISSNIFPTSGEFEYKKIDEQTGSITLHDSFFGRIEAEAINFSSKTTAAFTLRVPGAQQSGTLVLEGEAPPSIAGADSLVNLSFRAIVPPGTETIPGFVLVRPAKALVRASGPALSKFDVPNTMANPKLTVFSGSAPIAGNDDWSSSQANRQAVAEAEALSGASPFEDGSLDAAIMLDLDAGLYTALVEDADGGGGETLVEVFLVPDIQ